MQTSSIHTLQTISTLPRLETDCLLAHVLHVDRSHLLAWPDKPLSTEQIQQFHGLTERRLVGEPLAYILGEKEFWSLPFKVNEHVLIPRPETELIVEKVLALFNPTEALSVLDLGTGSGAIAVSLAHECPQWKITAVDKSQDALNIAIANAKQNDCPHIQFIQSDWFSVLPEARFNVIVTNPPYIAPDDPHLIQGDLRFEPTTALAAERQGIADLQTIITQAKQHLLPHGYLLLEHGFNQAVKVQELLQKAGFCEIFTQNDLADHPRLTYAIAEP